MTKGTTLAGALGVGAALWYLYDRKKEASRRAALQKSIESVARSFPVAQNAPYSTPSSDSPYLGHRVKRWRPSKGALQSLAGAGLALYGMRGGSPIGRIALDLAYGMFQRGRSS